MKSCSAVRRCTVALVAALNALMLTSIAEAVPKGTSAMLQVAWSSQARDGVTISLADQGERAGACLSRGFEPRIRYRVLLCWRRLFWADGCADQYEEFRSLQFDSVSETYRLVRDKIGDKLEATQESVPNLVDGVAQMSAIPELDLSRLGWARDDRRYYISVRVVGDCKGEYNEMLASIPYYLSLGLVRIGSVNTGWIDFDLSATETTIAPKVR